MPIGSFVEAFIFEVERPILILRMIHDRKQIHLLDSAGGMKPVFAVYSSFLQRAFDQTIHDVCLQNLPVVRTTQPLMTRFVHRLQVNQKKIA